VAGRPSATPAGASGPATTAGHQRQDAISGDDRRVRSWVERPIRDAAWMAADLFWCGPLRRGGRAVGPEPHGDEAELELACEFR